MWLLKARWNAASDWYPTASATAPVERDESLNSFAASVIRMSVKRSLADLPSFSWNCRASVARDILQRRARSGSDHARAGPLNSAATAGAKRG